MAKELKIEPNCSPDPDLPEALKLFPERLVALGNRDQRNRQEIAQFAGRNPAQVGRWLAYKQLQDLAASALIGIENGFGLFPGTLLSPKPIELGNSATVPSVSSVAETMGISASVVRALVDGSGVSMREFGAELKRAVLGAVHLLGYPLETATSAARAAMAEASARGPIEGLTPEMWFTAMRPHLRGKFESGTYPSSSKIKIG